MRHLVYALLLLQLSFSAAAADSDAELEKLYSALTMLNQQQQSIFQQFQMVQELRRGSFSPFYGVPIPSQLGGEITSYDAAVAAQKNAIQRGENLSQQADALLAKYNEIEEMKRPIQLKIYDLSLKAGQD